MMMSGAAGAITLLGLEGLNAVGIAVADQSFPLVTACAAGPVDRLARRASTDENWRCEGGAGM
jgi:hypothetical protein